MRQAITDSAAMNKAVFEFIQNKNTLTSQIKTMSRS